MAENGGETVDLAQKRPYCFTKSKIPPRSLYDHALKAVLKGYIENATGKRYFNSSAKGRGQRMRRQLERYFGVLPDHLKQDLLRTLFGDRGLSYRQAHRTELDKDMYDNNLCCTYPEECTGYHSTEYAIPKQGTALIWKILQGKSSTRLNLLPFLENSRINIELSDLVNSSESRDFFRDNQLSDVENEILKNPKYLANVQQALIVAAKRELNYSVWSKVMSSMKNLQSLELHFWSGTRFLELIHDTCVDLRELILSRQLYSWTRCDLETVPRIINKFHRSLRVLIVDSKDEPFTQKVSRDIQKSLSDCERLECLKLESEESPYLHWCNTRYKVKTKKLLLTLRRSGSYRTIIRNINRCINSDVDIDLFYDTYVDIENHKLTYLSQGPISWGGENTVSQATRNFEAEEVGGAFYKNMIEFGGKVKRLSTETDIRPEYFQFMFPNLEYLEMFARASRKVPVDPRFKVNTWRNLSDFVFEVDPSFSSLTEESLIINMVGDVLNYSNNLTSLKVLAYRQGLKIPEHSFLIKLRQVKANLSKLARIEFLSPFCINNSGLTAQVAEFFLANCPALEVLRDVASWSGTPAAWNNVAAKAEAMGLMTGWAQKTNTTAIYTLDFDAEGWIQNDTGHQFELYHNLNDDWEVVEDEEGILGLDVDFRVP